MTYTIDLTNEIDIEITDGAVQPKEASQPSKKRSAELESSNAKRLRTKPPPQLPAQTNESVIIIDYADGACWISRSSSNSSLKRKITLKQALNVERFLEADNHPAIKPCDRKDDDYRWTFDPNECKIHFEEHINPKTGSLLPAVSYSAAQNLEITAELFQLAGLGGYAPSVLNHIGELETDMGRELYVEEFVMEADAEAILEEYREAHETRVKEAQGEEDEEEEEEEGDTDEDEL